MRLVYVDEAGISHPEQEPFLVVAGAIVHADKALVATERHLDKIVKRHIPEAYWKDFVFHATHLFNWGGSVFTRNHPDYPLTKRLEIAAEIASIPKRHNIQLAFRWLKRSEFLQHVELPADLPKKEWVIAQHATAYMVCAMKVEHWMRINASSEICMLVVEDNQQARRRIQETQRYYQRNDVVESLDDEAARRHFPFRKIREDPLFQEKRSGSALQLADFCAYVFKRHLMGDSRYDPIFNALRSQIVVFRDGTI